MNEDDIKTVELITNEFLEKMTMGGFSLTTEISSLENQHDNIIHDVVNLDIKMSEPKFLIGQNGQTLLELERILRIILNRKLQKSFYLKVDINDYQKGKIESLKILAKESADEVSLTKKEKVLSPMSSYERRIIHVELAERKDVLVQSQDVQTGRCIVITPR